jgi:hypothetical protein
VNHRIFERTVRPLVFRRAYLFERQFSLKKDFIFFGIARTFLKLSEMNWQGSFLAINVLGFTISLEEQKDKPGDITGFYPNI